MSACVSASAVIGLSLATSIGLVVIGACVMWLMDRFVNP